MRWIDQIPAGLLASALSHSRRRLLEVGEGVLVDALHAGEAAALQGIELLADAVELLAAGVVVEGGHGLPGGPANRVRAGAAFDGVREEGVLRAGLVGGILPAVEGGGAVRVDVEWILGVAPAIGIDQLRPALSEISLVGSSGLIQLVGVDRVRAKHRKHRAEARVWQRSWGGVPANEAMIHLRFQVARSLCNPWKIGTVQESSSAVRSRQEGRG